MSNTQSGNLSRSMRENYTEHGVDQYYQKVGKTYRNPHFEGVKACIFSWMNRWYKNEYRSSQTEHSPIIFDMACGSGEVTLSLLQWHEKMMEVMNQLHSQAIKDASQDQTILPKRLPTALNIIAADPYTADAYGDRTGMPCETQSFQDIADGALPKLPTVKRHIASPKHNHEGYARHSESDHDRDLSSATVPGSEVMEDISNGENEEDSNAVDPVDSLCLDMVICSFALHLISPSELFALLWQLSTKATWLIILAPHKKPEIKDGWGWTKWNTATWTECSMSDNAGEILEQRVHCRVYKSLNRF